MSDSDGIIEPIDDGGDDLFGDEGDDDIVPTKEESVNEDDELASDPEGDTYARYRNDDEDQAQLETKERAVQTVTTYRHRTPKPKDGALRVLRIPKFMKIMPEEYNPDTFQPTEFDIANAKSEHPKHVARVRRDHSTGELKSNTNVFHWSDGSVTISVGGEHYEVNRKALAPPPDKPYNEVQDGHYYAAAAELHSNILMTVGHITEQYNVRPNKAVGDDALSRLAERMASASKPANSSDMIIRTTRDPELQKKQAELAEKERMKAQRRRENAEAKMVSGVGRSSGRGGGLSIGDLEGGSRGAGGSRKRGAPGAGKPRRRRDEESDEDLEEAVGRHEGYSLDDGFIVGSDDEEMDSQAADDDEEELLDDDEDEKPRSKRQRTKERSEDEGSDVEQMAGRSRRRNVIDDDDD